MFITAMDADVITLSSDEDSESPKSSKDVTNTTIIINSAECLSRLQEKLKEKLCSGESGKNEKIKACRFSGNAPEVVDLVECTDKSPENENDSKVQNHSKTNSTEAYFSNKVLLKHYVDVKSTNEETPNIKNSVLQDSSIKTETGTEKPNSKISQEVLCSKMNNSTSVKIDATITNCKNEISPGVKNSSNIFMEFVDHCASLEDNPKYREKLIGKLKKCFNNVHPEYAASEEFRILVQKHRNKINKNNIYIVAKSIGDEMKLHKIVKEQVKNQPEEDKEKLQNGGEILNSNSSPQREKRLAKIQKIVKKLNQLGSRIRELEVEEVDLSDEEDSVYLKLQRHRERFWTIYKQLCEVTNDAEIDRVFNQKLHFTETDYPAINRCIEKWLNKTKRFPDFADIMKILETQSTELGLASHKDTLRTLGTAIEIFQKVGNILQIRRKYDLWDSFCGFLDGSEDPAMKDPELDKIFKQNYENRVKKEQEIYQHYAERQEKESLQPNEVAEEDAERSPESGNEEEQEIDNIEKNLAEKLTEICGTKQIDGDENLHDEKISADTNAPLKEKESKNNFKNCKSLKWRSKSEGSDNSATDTDVNGEKAAIEGRNDSDPELILVEPDNQNKCETPTRPCVNPSPKKRSSPSGKENCPKKKRRLSKEETNIADFKEDGEKLKKTPVFDVGYCHIVTKNNLKERRKFFRDWTNLNKFMKNQGLNKLGELFTPPFLFSRYSVKKVIPWKKRFKINLREVKPKNQKCALNEEEKTNEKITSGENRESDKDGKDNTGDEKEGADFSGQGNGQEEDNNDKGDENRNNGKVEDENDDHEEDEDEEKEEEKMESEHSSNAQKTERENEDLMQISSNENHTLETENDVTVEQEVENNTRCYEESSKDTGNKSSDVEEFESIKNSLEPICVLNEDPDIIERDENPGSTCREAEKLEKYKTGPFTRSTTKATDCSKNETHNQRRLPVTASWTPPAETSQPKPRKMSASDEERVKRFLMHSPSSISITPPRKLTLSKPPSQSALQALATLRNLKGISATIVKGKPKTEDDVTVIGGQTRRQPEQTAPPVKRRRTDLPVISNVQSVNTLTPKIVTVQGNVSGFENLWPETRNNGSRTPDSSSIRISKVWGSLPETMARGNPSNYPGCSSRKSNPGTSNQVRKKTPKKQVEYVVLD